MKAYEYVVHDGKTILDSGTIIALDKEAVVLFVGQKHPELDFNLPEVEVLVRNFCR